MKQQIFDTDRAAGAAFFPYGLDRDAAPAAGHLHPGAAEVVGGDGQRGSEVYALERAAEHWHLYSKAFDQSWHLLARVHHGRLRWRRIEARIPKTALRAEGHEVSSGSGPIGTTEHVLVLRHKAA